MKNKLIFLTIGCLAFIGCDSDFDNNPSTICNAKFYSFQSQDEATALGDLFNVGYLTKFSPLTPSVFTNAIPHTPFTGAGTLFYPSSTLKNDNLQLVCLTNMSGSKRLFKANLTTLVTTQNNAIGSNLSGPVYVNNDLRFLKINNKVTQTVAPYNDVISFNVQLVDELGTSFSGTPQNIILPSLVENGFRDANIEGIYLNNKIYFLANCQLLVYDTITTVFSVHTIASYNQTNDKKFIQGMKISSSNNLLLMKQTILPSIKIEIIELPTIGSSNFTSTVLFNLQQSNFPSNAPQLAAIINTSDRRSTAYDKCDNKYYFTYMSSYTPYNTTVYEVDLNALSITNYPLPNTFLFGLEVQN